MTDDVGFGAPATLGGGIPTPTLDRIAANGLRYNNFHTTAMCSPTCAAIFTGRNHHSAGYGVIGEMATDFRGYNSITNKDTATIGRIRAHRGAGCVRGRASAGSDTLSAQRSRDRAQGKRIPPLSRQTGFSCPLKPLA
jgi:hypothetical protein